MRRYKVAEKVGKRMRIIRRKKKLTQEEVASLTGIHLTTYGRIERGETNPPLQTLNKIAKAIGISLSDIIN